MPRTLCTPRVVRFKGLFNIASQRGVNSPQNEVVVTNTLCERYDFCIGVIVQIETHFVDVIVVDEYIEYQQHGVVGLIGVIKHLNAGHDSHVVINGIDVSQG